MTETEQRSFKAEPYVPMDLGSYEFKVTRIEGPEEGKFGEQYIWHFECLDPEYDSSSENSKTIKAFSSVTFNPRSKPWEWAEAILGRKISMGEEIGFDELLGKRVMIHVDHKETERGTFERIAALTPVRRKKGEQSLQAPTQAEDAAAPTEAEADAGPAEEDEEKPPF